MKLETITTWDNVPCFCVKYNVVSHVIGDKSLVSLFFATQLFNIILTLNFIIKVQYFVMLFYLLLNKDRRKTRNKKLILNIGVVFLLHTWPCMI